MTTPQLDGTTHDIAPGTGLPTRALDRVGARFENALRAGARVVTLAAPWVPDVATFWPAEGDALVFGDRDLDCAGVGIARRAAATDAATMLTGLEPKVAFDDVDAPPLSAFGGFAFDAEDATDPRWASFGPGEMVVPRWTYGATRADAWIRFVTVEPLSNAEAESARLELEAAWARLLSAPARSGSAVLVTDIGQPPAEEWARHIREITEAIERGEAGKVVAARRVDVRLSGTLDPRVVLRRLRVRFPNCVRFAFRKGEATFLGATPEHLISKVGTTLRTEALAGSAPAGDGQSLLTSEKDQHEHRLVVDAIRTALEPHATLEMEAKPSLRELPNVVHLHTAIRGTLHDATHVLELVRALHPTPAVGGVPKQVAADWIATRERARYGARGWYAAPFGAFDEHGDGRFVVALRSGLLTGDSASAWAGCGIVGASEPEREYEESALKFRAFLGALEPAR